MQGTLHSSGQWKLPVSNVDDTAEMGQNILPYTSLLKALSTIWLLKIPPGIGQIFGQVLL